MRQVHATLKWPSEAVRSPYRRDNAWCAVVVQTGVFNVLEWLRMARNVPWPRYGKARPIPPTKVEKGAHSVDIRKAPPRGRGVDQSLSRARKTIIGIRIGARTITAIQNRHPRREATYATSSQSVPVVGASMVAVLLTHSLRSIRSTNSAICSTASR